MMHPLQLCGFAAAWRACAAGRAAGSEAGRARLASNRRWTDSDGQEREETIYLSVNAWHDLAENVAETFVKGDRVIAMGRLKVRSYENRDGQSVTVTEIEADAVAPSLRWAQATIDRDGGSARGPAPAAGDDLPF